MALSVKRTPLPLLDVIDHKRSRGKAPSPSLYREELAAPTHFKAESVALGTFAGEEQAPIIESRPARRHIEPASASLRLSLVGRAEKPIFQQAQSYIQRAGLSLEGNDYILTLPGTDPHPVKKLGSGCYKDVFGDNTTVWKFYSYLKNTKSRLFKLWTETSVNQYQQLTRLGLPCARILNHPLTDGYFVQERVSQLLLDYCPLLKKLEPYTEAELAQISPIVDVIVAFFVTAIREKIDVDVTCANMGVTREGAICLFDFKEELDEDDVEELYLSLKKCLTTSWDKEVPVFSTHLRGGIIRSLGEGHPFLELL